jgi:hypothetical protein
LILCAMPCCKQFLLIPCSGHVLNPIDWAAFETLKDTSGQYIIGNPQGALNPTLWKNCLLLKPDHYGE